MSRVAFEYIAMELSPIISKRDTNFRKGISARQRLAVTLYRLADTASYRTIANLFAIGKSTVCEIVVQVCNAIVQFLLPRYVRLPQSAQEIRERIDESRDRAGFPQVVACVDGCHIPIKAPQNNPEDYWMRTICFETFVSDGLENVYDTINGVRVPPLILGDSAYPLQDWLMKPYVDRGNLSAEELQFNNLLSITRVVVENGYGRLKGRFPALAKRLDLNVNNCCTVIAARCVLHNFCEIMKEEFEEQWLLDIPINGAICPNEDVNQQQDRNAAAIREAIRIFLS
ncbi:unnamed protein product [Porites lobata]|uniref:DDE Tnp4 domain-containing protein n=1 Tax=Porites lobata TaxID=104759 RepID=A0ABN8MV88_9CNID|nr:unnamed protein product [Porites lobata]